MAHLRLQEQAGLLRYSLEVPLTDLEQDWDYMSQDQKHTLFAL